MRVPVLNPTLALFWSSSPCTIVPYSIDALYSFCAAEASVRYARLFLACAYPELLRTRPEPGPRTRNSSKIEPRYRNARRPRWDLGPLLQPIFLADNYRFVECGYHIEQEATCELSAHSFKIDGSRRCLAFKGRILSRYLQARVCSQYKCRDYLFK